MSGGKEIKNKIEILALLKALLLPTKVSITHCPGHQKGDSPVARGNNMADEAAREAARQAPFILAVQTVPSRKKGHEYTAEDLTLIHQDPSNQYDTEKKAWLTSSGKTILPQRQAWLMIKQMH